MTFFRRHREHAQPNQVVAEDDCDNQREQDEDDVDGLGRVCGGREGEVWVFVSKQEEERLGNVQIVRIITRVDPDIRQPMTLRLILGFLTPGKQRRRASFSASLGLRRARRSRVKSAARAGSWSSAGNREGGTNAMSNLPTAPSNPGNASDGSDSAQLRGEELGSMSERVDLGDRERRALVW